MERWTDGSGGKEALALLNHRSSINGKVQRQKRSVGTLLEDDDDELDCEDSPKFIIRGIKYVNPNDAAWTNSLDSQRT